MLAKELWRREPKRAHVLITEAIDKLRHAAAPWREPRQDALDWVASDGHPGRR